MSYRTWATYGFGFCVDDIQTTPERLLNLAAMEPSVEKIVKEYIEEGDVPYEDLTIDDFYELEGDEYERGIAFVLYNVIKEIPIVYAEDYDGVQYILYCPTYPWCMTNNEMNLTEDKVEEIFTKYIKILTGEDIAVDYCEVENGG